jgi:hypothetical protein
VDRTAYKSGSDSVSLVREESCQAYDLAAILYAGLSGGGVAGAPESEEPMSRYNPLLRLPHDRLALTSISLAPGGSIGIYWSGVAGEEPWKLAGRYAAKGYPDAPCIRAMVTVHAKDL